MFQADFMFVQKPNCPVELHRVVHNICIADAVSEHISVTTVAYAHEPQIGVCGFFGVFTPLLNAHYDPRDKRQGRKFIQHRCIGRDVIKVYNVAVARVKEGTRTVIRVMLSSLEQLAAKCPECLLPPVIPSSHDSDNAGGGDESEDELPQASCCCYCRCRT